jgi:hypothetical protein
MAGQEVQAVSDRELSDGASRVARYEAVCARWAVIPLEDLMGLLEFGSLGELLVFLTWQSGGFVVGDVLVGSPVNVRAAFHVYLRARWARPHQEPLPRAEEGGQ